MIEVDNKKETAKIIESNKTPGEKYTITYHPNGGEGEEKKVEVRKGFNKKLEKNNFTRADYIFVGWCEDKDGNGKKYMEESVYPLNGNVTLYAIWSYNVATITFDANGGTGTMESKKVTKGEATILTANVFQKEGYDFEKWNTKVDGTGTDYADLGSITVDKNTTLYAMWKKMTIEDAIEKQEVFEKNTPILDENGNQVVIPGGFKVAPDSAKDVTEGIVIRDEVGNEFVWIPVNAPEDFVRVEGYSGGSKQSELSSCNEPGSIQGEKGLYTTMYNSVTNPNNKGFYCRSI